MKAVLAGASSTNSQPGSSATSLRLGPLDAHFENEYGIEMITPNRSGLKRRTQDGHPLCRYRKRWKVERLFAWIHNFRRLVTRWEYHIENFLGFVHLVRLQMLMRYMG